MANENLCGNPQAISDYLTEMFDKNDVGSILEAITLVLRAQNVKALAESTGMRRDGLYKTFSGSKKDPQFSRVLKLCRHGSGQHVQNLVAHYRRRNDAARVRKPLNLLRS